jgi:hypothetical protein
MIKSNRSLVSITNVLIASQCLIDAFYSFGSILCYVIKLSGLNHYSHPPTKFNSVICILLDSGTTSAVVQNSSIVVLTAIALERYLKVVYPIGHRKNYRPWMTCVTIGVTWLSGFVMFLLPSVFTTRILYGQCYLTAVWANVAASNVGCFWRLLM